MTVETVPEAVPEVQEAPEGPPVDTDESSEEAPYGWMTDPVSGLRRPKKRPGKRSSKAQMPTGPTPTLADLQELGSLPETGEDVAPGAPRKRRGRGARASKPAPELPPFRAGVISKGVNGLYRKAGRLARLMHYDIGTAIIATTHAQDEDDLTVGEAWENVAKTNPRIRAFWLRVIAGGAIGDLALAHLPVLLAILMVDGIRQRIPVLKLAEAMLVDDDTGMGGNDMGTGGMPMPSGLAQMMGGITPQDMAQMMEVVQAQMSGVVQDMARPANSPREPTIDQGG